MICVNDFDLRSQAKWRIRRTSFACLSQIIYGTGLADPPVENRTERAVMISQKYKEYSLFIYYQLCATLSNQILFLFKVRSIEYFKSHMKQITTNFFAYIAGGHDSYVHMYMYVCLLILSH